MYVDERVPYMYVDERGFLICMWMRKFHYLFVDERGFLTCMWMREGSSYVFG